MDTDYYDPNAGPIKPKKKRRGWFRRFFSNFARIFKSDKTKLDRNDPYARKSFAGRTRNQQNLHSNQQQSNFHRNAPQTRSMPNIRNKSNNRSSQNSRSPTNFNNFNQPSRNQSRPPTSLSNAPRNVASSNVNSIKPAGSVKSPSISST